MNPDFPIFRDFWNEPVPGLPVAPLKASVGELMKRYGIPVTGDTVAFVGDVRQLTIDRFNNQPRGRTIFEILPTRSAHIMDGECWTVAEDAIERVRLRGVGDPEGAVRRTLTGLRMRTPGTARFLIQVEAPQRLHNQYRLHAVAERLARQVWCACFLAVQDMRND